jgi:CubicO group peptidase (beta-lactamase class C family)
LRLSWPAALLAGCLSAAVSPALAVPCPARTDAPAGEWPTRAAEVGAAHPATLARLDELVFTLTGTEAERKGLRTDGVVVVHHGKVLYEKYARGHSARTRHQAWSISKSVTSLLAGVARAKAGFDLDASICDHVMPSNAELCQITGRHLLGWTSGIAWKEFYEDESNQKSSVLAMLYGEGHKDMLAFMLGHELGAAPGTVWSYSTGDNTLLMGVLQAAMKKAGHGDDWPWELLFDRIGAPRITFERDAAGTYVGGSTLLATPRDLARLGFLAVNDGCWNEERLLPAGWMDETLTLTPAYKGPLPQGVDPLDSPGLSWWLNKPVPEHQQSTPIPTMPEDLVWGRGHWGQYLYASPSLDLVAVRFGDDRQASFPHADFLAAVLELTRDP